MSIEDSQEDTQRFENAFAFKAKVGIEEGLRREVGWYRPITLLHITLPPFLACFGKYHGNFTYRFQPKAKIGNIADSVNPHGL